MVFTSRRLYGNQLTEVPWLSWPPDYDTTSLAQATVKKLWVAAIDLNAPPGTDLSHPAFYLPAQEILAGNSRGFWVLDPCKQNGQACQTGDQCCNGYCEADGEGGALVCASADAEHVLGSAGEVHDRVRLLRHDEHLRQRLLRCAVGEVDGRPLPPEPAGAAARRSMDSMPPRTHPRPPTPSGISRLAFAACGLAACAHADVAQGPAAPVGAAVTSAGSAALPEDAAAAPRAPLAWAELTPATFAKAKAERKFLVLDGSAEWCHWCHVMEATTYHDPAVQALLAARFIAVKVDIDARPDIGERYGDWGWPATVIFSPDAEEIGKYRGYIAPADFADILREVAATGANGAGVEKPRMTPLPPPTGKLTDRELAFLERDTEAALDEYYDDDQGGWGRMQKAPIAPDNQWALLRAAEGDAVMRKRALFTLAQQAGVLDPVWGGIYQYSVGHDWTHPHFEKLMPFEAGAVENYATAYALTGDPKLLATAEAVRRYVDEFLLSKEGGFYATQDADLNAHDASKPFLSGHAFYALGDAERRQRGVPRVDTHEYGRENGLAIAAYVTLHEATCRPVGQGACDEAALATARRAAARILATHRAPNGGIAHDADPAAHVLHLADNAAFGHALARLFEATHDVAYRDAAEQIVDVMQRELSDPATGAFFGSTRDPDAVGVFAQRRVPFEENVMAIRLLAKLATVGHEERRAAFAALAERALEGIARPEEIRGRGRMIGDFLLALEDVRRLRLGR